MAKQANAKVKKSMPASSNANTTESTSAQHSTDAVSLLKQDHRQVEQLFAKFTQAQSTEKFDLARQICLSLIVHTQIEEEIFYPACREKQVQAAMLAEAQVEHDGAKIMINELMCTQPNNEFYDAKAKILMEYIKHHVGEEEKSGGIFAQAAAAGVDMNALGQRLQARKQELMEAAETSGFSVPNPRSLMIQTERKFDNDEEKQSMATENYQQRNQQGRFSNNEDDRGQYRSQNGGRYRDDDDRGGRSGYRSNERDRDDQGRFVSDEDRGQYRSQSGGRYRDDDERSNRSNQNYDEGSSSRGGRGQGWFGDSEGHSEAAQRRGQFEGGSRRYEGRYEEDDRGSRASSGRGQGWFGDSEGHSEAAQRRGGASRYEEDDDRGSRGSSGGRGQGWFGDPEGHSEAARQRWQSEGSGRGGSRSERDSRDDNRADNRDDNRGGRGGSDHRGWFGDSRGHSEASRRGWQNRD